MIDNVELKLIIYDFFFKFSRFEFALKECKYRKSGKYGNNAEPDWESFINDYEKTFQVNKFAKQFLQYPPRRQVIKNGQLDCEGLSFKANYSPLRKAVLALKTIRNNLFHGGKYGDKSWDDPDRIEFLLSNGNELIDQLSKLNGDLEAHYRDEY